MPNRTPHVEISDGPPEQSNYEFEMRSGGVYYATVETVEPNESGFVELDVVEAREDLLFTEEDGWRTLTEIRETWRRAFTERDSAVRVARRLDAFGGGMVRAQVGNSSSRWPEWLVTGQWLRVEVSHEGVDAVPVDPPTAKRLSALFTMKNFPSATAGKVRAELAKVADLTQVIALDVGQGSANAMVDATGVPQLYFDVGAGAGRNGKTRPKTYHFCVHGSPLVVLSHWDIDHWAGAREDSSLLGLRWIAPRQLIGPQHAKHAAKILAAGGELLIVKGSSSPRGLTRGSSQELTLLFGEGKAQNIVKNDRNDCGQILIVRNLADNLCWVLPGDASYAAIPKFSGDAVVLVASHHGAEIKKGNIPPDRCAGPYARLLYSFGPDNSYKHPHAASLAGHALAKWAHDPGVAWGPDVRSTSQTVNGSNIRHSIAGGWDGASAQPGHLFHRHGLTVTL